MGIPGFYGHWITNYVRHAIFKGLPPVVSSLAFDLNGVFHDARKKVFDNYPRDERARQAFASQSSIELELKMQAQIEKIILDMVYRTTPQDCLILAVAGVAPAAKLQPQPGRRERSAFERSGSELFDKNAITPGTDFMMRLDSFIIRFIDSNRDSLPRKVIYSSHLVPGEGEHKIMEFYRSGEVTNDSNGAHVLYGLDADLIMLSLLSPLSNIFLSRETIAETVSIDVVKDYLKSLSQSSSVVDDFVIMMTLIGNDFLPHSPSLSLLSESINNILDIYSAGDFSFAFVDQSGIPSINWDSFAKFIDVLSNTESTRLANLSTVSFAFPSRFFNASVDKGVFHPAIFRKF